MGAWDLGLDQVQVQADPELDQVRVQVGHLGWLGEHLPNMVGEGRHLSWLSKGFRGRGVP